MRQVTRDLSAADTESTLCIGLTRVFMRTISILFEKLCKLNVGVIWSQEDPNIQKVYIAFAVI